MLPTSDSKTHKSKQHHKNWKSCAKKQQAGLAIFRLSIFSPLENNTSQKITVGGDKNPSFLSTQVISDM